MGVGYTRLTKKSFCSHKWEITCWFSSSFHLRSKSLLKSHILTSHMCTDIHGCEAVWWLLRYTCERYTAVPSVRLFCFLCVIVWTRLWERQTDVDDLQIASTGIKAKGQMMAADLQMGDKLKGKPTWSVLVRCWNEASLYLLCIVITFQSHN